MFKSPQPPFAKGGRGGITEIIRYIEKDRINIATKFAKETGTYLVLKGVPTVIAEPEGRVFINPTGNSGMASAGTGDVLAGMLAGFLGQGLNPLEASILGVYMHGLAGDMAAKSKGEHSLIASDIIDSIPEAFQYLQDTGYKIQDKDIMHYESCILHHEGYGNAYTS